MLAREAYEISFLSELVVDKRWHRFLQSGGAIDETITDEEILAEDTQTMDIDEDPTNMGEQSRRGGEDGGRA